ncbi:hypothetical protein AKJ09_00534 [Labilithrix luteola]|uniref:Uncharacterized protein n=1 Tax=Labilithrix luteola TaxID=1391654 RepID=A0A0K1PK16_9BACT|nr:hypothetical protein AKJ09_00534 [Labilithrix luteola]
MLHVPGRRANGGWNSNRPTQQKANPPATIDAWAFERIRRGWPQSIASIASIAWRACPSPWGHSRLSRRAPK